VEDPFAESNALLGDIVINYRTIMSFGEYNINTIMTTYENMIIGADKAKVRNSIISGIAYGYSQGI